jgi:hypothetical protein
LLTNTSRRPNVLRQPSTSVSSAPAVPTSAAMSECATSR